MEEMDVVFGEGKIIVTRGLLAQLTVSQTQAVMPKMISLKLTFKNEGYVIALGRPCR